MYCGTEMPAVAVPPEPRALPENLDALIRAAMSGQGTADLKTALLQASDAALPSAVAEDALEPAELVDLDTSSLQPLELVPEPLDALDAPAAPRMIPNSAISTEESTIDDGLTQLERMLAEARQAWKASDLRACRSSLGLLQAQLPSLISQLPESAGATLSAPLAPSSTDEPVRIFEAQGSWSSAGHPFALVVECPADASKAPLVARVLETDGVTARMLAVSRYPRVVLRSSDAESLQKLRIRYAVSLGLEAVVVSRESLLDIGLPEVVLGPAGLQGFRVCDAPLWLKPEHDSLLDGRVVRAPSLLLAVPGEVVTCHYRHSGGGAQGRNATAYQLSHESRIGVLDLHGPGIFLRIVEGTTNFQGLPGYISDSRRRSFRGLSAHIGEWFPAIQKFGSRVCRPTGEPHPSPDQSPRPRLEVNAWPMWEEYTRLCRLLLGIA